MALANTLQHLKDIKKLNSILEEHQNKLDQKVNQAINHMMNYSFKINDLVLPQIQNKKIYNTIKYSNSFNHSKRNIRTRSVGTKSFIHKSIINVNNSQITQADTILENYKQKSIRRQIRQSEQVPQKQMNNRPIGSQKYTKPKFTKRNPDILPKQMRHNPFCEKNAIKANQLQKGMLSLIESGKVGKNIDIITAFEKGRPVLQTHQAIVHQAQQKYAYAQLEKTHEKQKKIRTLLPVRQGFEKANISQTIKIQNQQFHFEDSQPNWALTMPQNTDTYNDYANSPRKTKNLSIQDLQNFNYLLFKEYKLIKDEQYLAMKKKPQYYEQWGNIMSFSKQIQKLLKQYSIHLVYINSKILLNHLTSKQILKKPGIQDIKQCMINQKKTYTDKSINSKLSSELKVQSLFSIQQIPNNTVKKQKAAIRIQATFRRYRIQKTFLGILHRKKVQKKVKQWVHNGLIIKNYRKQLKKHITQIHMKFQAQQKQFLINYPTIQSSKHYQIHVPNRQFMNGFTFMEQMSNVQITRIFNLQNPQTDLIYICPWEISIQTINYYFKIMELQQIQGYHDRVTFLELNGDENRTNLPNKLNTSAKLYYNTKALRKLKKKIGDRSAYFVINQPTEIDIRMSVYLNIPILSGNMKQLKLTRSFIASKQFSQSLQKIEVTPSFAVQPYSTTILALSNSLLRFCQSNKQTNKFILKINNKHNSSGMALLTYPFTSLPQMYSSTALVQTYYYPSIQKFYIDFIHKGGVIQKYQQGIKTLTISGKILHDGTHSLVGTFERISSGFMNISYTFPQRVVPHKDLYQKCKGVIKRLIELGHFGNFELTLMIDANQNITLQEIQLFSTKITHSLSYFKFLAGGYFNNLGEFITKITGEEGQDQEIATMQSRTFCYIPFLLHFGLSQKQTTSFFQLCRIGGVSFDLQNKYGSTFILLGSMKNCIGVITSAKDKKSACRLMGKTLQFLIKQNSHNISNEMLTEKEHRLKNRYNVVALKDRIDNI